MRIAFACLLVSMLAVGGLGLAGCEAEDYGVEPIATPPSLIAPQPPLESAPNVDPAVQRYLDPSGSYAGWIKSGEPGRDCR